MLSGPAKENNGRKENTDQKGRVSQIDWLQYLMISFGILCSLIVVTLLVWVSSVYLYGQGINPNSSVTLEHGIPMNQIALNNQIEDTAPTNEEDTIQTMPAEETEDEKREREKREHFWRLYMDWQKRNEKKERIRQKRESKKKSE